MAWTNVDKPTGPTWTKVGLGDNTTFDDASVTYDSATVLYDGSASGGSWTNISKPTSSVWTTIAKPT